MTMPISATALSSLLLLGALLWWQQRSQGVQRWLLLLPLVLLALALGLHLWPGFARIDLWQGQLSPCASEGRWGLSLDKGLAGLVLLLGLRGIWRPDRPSLAPQLLLVRLLAGIAGLLALAHLSGFIRWHPAAPPWWPLWLLSNVVMTVAAEEALFRGLLQREMERAWLRWRHGALAALLLTSLLFGVAHAGGGPVYALLATGAGVLYGHLWQAGRSLLWPLAAHTALNACHFLWFTWPAANGSGCVP